MAGKQVKACIFDMDGLLLNTEEIYTKVANKVLEQYGKPPLPWEVKIRMQGRPGAEATRVLLEWAQLPFTPEEFFSMTTEHQKDEWQHSEWMPGALELLRYLHGRNVPIALATSSLTRNYKAKTAHLRDGFDLFGPHVVTGDDPRVPAGCGKPKPHIFLAALESLNSERRVTGLPAISPDECIVFEDGVPGVIAGTAAGCRVVWVPDPRGLEVMPAEEVEQLRKGLDLLRSLEEFDKAKYGL